MKRKTLERNLKRVVSRIEEGITPIRIVEVWGFGSFFRPKDEPEDFDTVIFYKEDPEFDKAVNRFSRLIQDLNKTEEGRKIIEDSISNQPHPRLVDVWMKYTKVSGHMRTYYGDYHFDSVKITRKVILEGIRGIQISEIFPVEEKDNYFSSMSTQSLKLVWSEDERDVDKNLHQSTEEQVALTLAEMKNFAIQVERYKSYYDVLTNVLKCVIEKIQLHSSLTDEEQAAKRAHIVGSERGILEPYLKWISNQIKGSGSADEPGPKEHVTSLDIDGEIDRIKDSVRDVSELGVICESMRGDIDEFRSRCTFAHRLLSILIDSSDQLYVPPIEERVSSDVHFALRNVPMKEAKDDVKRRVLTDLVLDDISRTIVLVETLGGKSEYIRADSEEDLQRLIDRSNKGKTEKKHAKYIRPLLRKAFPKSADTRVSFSTLVGENGVAIPQKVYLTAVSYEEDSDEFLNIAKKMEFVIDESNRSAYKAVFNTDYHEATLDIDINQLNGDKKRIKKLIESKLRFSTSDTNIEPSSQASERTRVPIKR